MILMWHKREKHEFRPEKILQKVSYYELSYIKIRPIFYCFLLSLFTLVRMRLFSSISFLL